MNVKYCIVFVAAVLFAALTMPTTAATVTFTGHVVADFVGPGVFSQVDTTDQNITDPRFNTNPPGCMDAPMGEVCFLVPPAKFSPSGFNVQAVYWTYDCATDCLYIGLRLPDERIAWDSNDDDNILTSFQAPPAILQQQFSDTDYEEYVLFFGVDQTNPNTFTETFKITIADMNGGIDPQISVTKGGLPYAGVTATWFKGPRTPPNYPGTEKDIEVKVCGIRAAYPGGGPGKPCVLTTRSGGPGDLTDEDTTEQVISLTCDACISVTKQVACSPNGPWVPLVEVPVSFDSSSDAVQANAHGLLNGDQVKFDSIITTTGINTSTLYYVVNANANSFQISLTKGGTPVDLINNGTGTYHKVSHVDILAGNPVYFKLDVTNCGSENLINVTVTDTGCSGGATDCGNIVIGNLASGETKSQTCSYASIAADCINTATATGSGEFTGTTVTAVDFATVSVLTPSIICTTLVDDNPNFTHNSSTLDLPCGSDIAQVYYRLCITNKGQVPIDFGTTGPCGITDSLLDNAFTGISGLPANVCALFRAQPQLATGILAPGATVCVTVGPLGFDKCTLCKNETTSITNDFKATGLANLGDCGSTLVSTDTCTTTVNVCCQPDLTITKEVACSTLEADCANGVYGSSTTALRGAYVCFKLTVTNTGCDDLKDVVITDTLTDDNAALLPCEQCCTGDHTIPGSISVGNLAVGASQTFYCKVQTNPVFSIFGTAVDATNTASAVGVGVTSGITANAGPSSATVNVLVPRIECSKLVNDSTDFTNATNFLDLGGPTCTAGIKTVYYKLCINNTGDIAVDFTKGDCAEHFADSLLDNLPTGITLVSTTPATNPVSISQAFLNQLTNGTLPAGGSVCVVVATSYDEEELCKTQSTYDNIFTACGLATDANVCLPADRGEQVLTEGCSATVEICCPCRLEITKLVSCSADGPFTENVQAVAGSDVYFKICVKNIGSMNIDNITVTDTLPPSAAFDSCVECKVNGTPVPCFINSGSWNVGSLAIGAEACVICKVKTKADFSVIGQIDDIVNSASASGVCALGSTITAGPAVATVDLLVASIACEKWVDVDEAMTNPVKILDAGDPMHPQTNAFFQTCVINTGEVDIDFTGAGTTPCPSFIDPKIATPNALIPGTGVDVNAAMLAELQALNGSAVLKPGQRVCHVFGPLLFDQAVLCPAGISNWLNEFSACGMARQDGVCGEKTVSTGTCDALVVICPPTLKQVFCGLTCDTTNSVQKGFAGIGPDTITAVPGVFAINPGDSQWSNWVKAAGEQVPYTLTKVTLRKHMDQSTDCPDVFPGEDVIQIWPKMQLWWPLMYEIPGTTFVITVYYDTLSPWDEGGTKPPTISHAEAFSFRVDASLPDLKKLLALFHQLPLGSHQVPVISDEALYLKMRADLDEVIGLIEQGNTSLAGEKLLDFQLLVENHCIEIFAPTKPLVGGAGTGIANTCENPACCKILADVTWIQNELGLLHP